MSGQLKRCNESWFGSLQSGQFAAGWLAGFQPSSGSHPYSGTSTQAQIAGAWFKIHLTLLLLLLLVACIGTIFIVVLV